MATIREIDSFFSELCPRELSESWDNDGVMLCGDANTNVSRVLVCLEINTDAVKAASENGAQLIITHHPFIFRPLKSVRGEYFTQIELLMKNGISVMSYHTRFDRAFGGVNDVLADILELRDVFPTGDFLKVGDLSQEMSGEEFASYLKDKLGCGVMKAYYEKDARIKRVAVCGGAGKDFLEEAASVSDAYVSADLAHNTFIDAKTYGTALYDAGHYFTENPAVRKLTDILRAEFPDITFDFFDVGSPYFTI